MKYRQIFLLTFCCLIIYSTTIWTRSIATYDDGVGDAVTDLDKAKIIRTSFVMTGSDYLLGAVDLRGGLFAGGYSVGGRPSQIGISFPIHTSLQFIPHAPDSTAHILATDLHLCSDAGPSFLIDLTQGGGLLYSGLFAFSRTIYLDSDITVSGPTSNGFAFYNVIIDGQGHTIDCSNSLYGGLAPAFKLTLRNMTLKNVWYDPNMVNPGLVAGRGNFNLNSVTDIILDNVTIIAREGKPFLFGLNDFGSRINVTIKNNVRLINYGQFIIQPTYYQNDARSSNFIISENSSLSVENSTLSIRPLYVYSGVTTYNAMNFMLQSASSQIVLDNGILEVDANNELNAYGAYALDTTLTLSVGTLVVKGNSSLIASSLLAQNGRGSIRLGNGVNTSGDMNIIIDPGATLNLIATNVNCSVKLQNIN
jgi:hypothetical protein